MIIKQNHLYPFLDFHVINLIIRSIWNQLETTFYAIFKSQRNIKTPQKQALL